MKDMFGVSHGIDGVIFSLLFFCFKIQKYNPQNFSQTPLDCIPLNSTRSSDYSQQGILQLSVVLDVCQS